MNLQLKCSYFHLLCAVLLLVLSANTPLLGQAQFGTVTEGATFGTVIPLGGTPSDVVVDELRQRLYIVDSGASRVTVYSYRNQQVEGRIQVGQFPSAAAISMDGRWLYVANTQSATLSVVDLDIQFVIQTVSLPARPEGVAVGFDGRVLITTQGSGTNNSLNTLLLFDRNQEAFQQLTPVPSPPPISTPNPLPPVFAGRPAMAFPGRLIRTPDGQFIVGMVAINQTLNSANTTLFLYEVASGTVLRNRTVTGQSTVLAISDDGARFMAGSTLHETATLNVLAQMSTANLPFQFANGFNPAITIARNFGGSIFLADGERLLGAFNTAANNPAIRPEARALLLASSRHLGVRLGLRMPESILGKMVAANGGDDVWASSESGLIHLPVGKLFEQPLLMPESAQVFLAVDPCNKGIARARVRVENIGGGKLTFTVPVVTTALIAQVTSGLAPSTIEFIMEPGRSGVVRQNGTNIFTGAGGGGGTALNINLQSREAVNFPNTIRVYMNFRGNDERGIIYPAPTTLANNEGLYELILDEPRGRVYLSNSGYNRIEVFDTRRLKFLDPIEVGQLPHSMAMSLDGSLLYVGNNGEWISVIDLDTRKVIGKVDFPPIPRPGNQNAIRPLALGMGLSGLQVIMSNGGLWRVLGNEAIPRPLSPIITPTGSVSTLAGPAQYSYAQTPGGEHLVALAGNGNAYLYDALADNFTAARLINEAPIQSYYGPASGATKGNFFALNGLILSPALAQIGGAQRPGAIQFGPPPAPGQPPTQTIVSAGQRHIASVVASDENTLLRMTIPVRANLNAQTRDDPRATIERVDTRTNAESVVAVSPENPPSLVFGAARLSVPARQLAVDSKGTAYAITLSGLSIIPLQGSSPTQRPQIPAGSRGVVNSNDGSLNLRPGSFVTVLGSNLAQPAVGETLPPPPVLGGSCVTFSDVAIPLLQTAPDQVSGQIPDTLRPGLYVVQVRNLAGAVTSDPVLVTVQRPE